jgi:hypothetical protein
VGLNAVGNTAQAVRTKVGTVGFRLSVHRYNPRSIDLVMFARHIFFFPYISSVCEESIPS